MELSQSYMLRNIYRAALPPGTSQLVTAMACITAAMHSLHRACSAGLCACRQYDMAATVALSKKLQHCLLPHRTHDECLLWWQHC